MYISGLTRYTHTYIYMYIYICVCVYTYIYIYTRGLTFDPFSSFFASITSV